MNRELRNFVMLAYVLLVLFALLLSIIAHFDDVQGAHVSASTLPSTLSSTSGAVTAQPTPTLVSTLPSTQTPRATLQPYPPRNHRIYVPHVERGGD